MKIKRIHYKDTLPIRSSVLRSGKPFEQCAFDGDSGEQSFHLGAFIDNKLVSIASFFYDKNQNLEAENQFRLRGMATLPSFQRQGFSRELLTMAFPIIKQNFCELLWCNARIGTIGFYEKAGFEKFGDVFLIPEIGDHQLMFKAL